MTAQRKEKTGNPKHSAAAVLVIGPASDRFGVLLKGARDNVEVRTARSLKEALELSRQQEFDCAIIDRQDEEHLIALLSIGLAAVRSIKRLIVISDGKSDDVLPWRHCVDAVVSDPSDIDAVLDAALAQGADRALGRPDHSMPTPNELRTNAKAGCLKYLSLMPLVSLAYKYFALVFLTGLFSVFVFYGAMICFFLLSSGWASPMTLSKGHDLVLKTEQELSSLRMRENLLAQQLEAANQQAGEAHQSLTDAEMRVQIAGGTIAFEIAHREKLQLENDALMARLKRVQAGIAIATRDTGMRDELAMVFEQRLIDRKAYNTGVLAILETGHRLAMIENEIASRELESKKIEASLRMLHWLGKQNRSEKLNHVSATSVDLLPLAHEVVEAKAAMSNARAKLKEVANRRRLVLESRSIASKSIAAIRETPLGRAVESPVFVLFVPYENASNFHPGKPLYACLFGIILCEKVGTVGEPIAGESNAVHPFFGKPIRGHFVNVHLGVPEAAKREMLLAGGPPLFL